MAVPFDAGGKKMEGMPPPWLQARTCFGWCVWVVGLKPGSGTQRLLPRFHACRAPDRTVSYVFRWGCLATEGARVVMPEGLSRSSRKAGARYFPSPAGAAHGTGNFETLSTLSPPVRGVS
jgi:hypothetical protein